MWWSSWNDAFWILKWYFWVWFLTTYWLIRFHFNFEVSRTIAFFFFQNFNNFELITLDIPQINHIISTLRILRFSISLEFSNFLRSLRNNMFLLLLFLLPMFPLALQSVQSYLIIALFTEKIFLRCHYLFNKVFGGLHFLKTILLLLLGTIEWYHVFDNLLLFLDFF